ncbi:hypothetical protein VDGL01_01841 [Verticillium dahliae]
MEGLRRGAKHQVRTGGAGGGGRFAAGPGKASQSQGRSGSSWLKKKQAKVPVQVGPGSQQQHEGSVGSSSLQKGAAGAEGCSRCRRVQQVQKGAAGAEGCSNAAGAPDEAASVTPFSRHPATQANRFPQRLPMAPPLEPNCQPEASVMNSLHLPDRAAVSNSKQRRRPYLPRLIRDRATGCKGLNTAAVRLARQAREPTWPVARIVAAAHERRGSSGSAGFSDRQGSPDALACLGIQLFFHQSSPCPLLAVSIAQRPAPSAQPARPPRLQLPVSARRLVSSPLPDVLCRVQRPTPAFVRQPNFSVALVATRRGGHARKFKGSITPRLGMRLAHRVVFFLVNQMTPEPLTESHACSRFCDNLVRRVIGPSRATRPAPTNSIFSCIR